MKTETAEDERNQLAQGMRELSQSLRRIEALAAPQSNASIRIDAGGAAVWIATTACLVMLGMMLVGGLWISREFERVDAIESSGNANKAYVSAIFQKLPELKAEIDQAKEPSK